LNLLLGLAGSAALLIGVFCPLVTLPIVGSISYIHNGRGDGIFVAVLAAISLVLVLCRFWVGLWFTSVLSLGILGFTFINFQVRLQEMKQELAGNPFGGIAETVSLSWGFAVIIVGAALLIAAAAVPPRSR
jgi:hypothetical protein